MDTHSSILAWRIPGTEKSGGLLSTHHKLGLGERDEACKVIAGRSWDSEEWGMGRDSKEWEPY